MSNVRPGMLARVVAPKNIGVITPEIIGRIVFVEREYKMGEIMRHVDGRRVVNSLPYGELAWVISANEPLPAQININEPEIWYMYERPMVDSCLRPLLDPDLGVTDEEVKELYSPKQRAEDHATVIQWPAFFPEKA